ncbi:hypothetical protein ACFL4T_13510 [candidate division KSB1 bacterium]
MKKSILSILILVSVCFFVFSFTNNSIDKKGDKTKKYNLKYDLKKGTKFTVVFTDEFERSTVLPDGDRTGNTIDDTYEGDFEVISSKSSGLSLELEIKSASRGSRNPGGTFNSTFDEIIGKKVRFTLSPEGVPSKLDVFTELPQQDKVLGRTAPDDFVQRLAALFPVLPEGSVDIGDSWNYEIEENRPSFGGLNSNIKCKYTYKILGEEKRDGYDCLKIEINYDQITKAEGERRGRPFKYEMGGKGKEIIYFAYKEGVFVYKMGEYNPDGGFNDSAMSDTAKYEVKVNIH